MEFYTYLGCGPTSLKVISELALLENGGENGLAAADEIAEVG